MINDHERWTCPRCGMYFGPRHTAEHARPTVADLNPTELADWLGRARTRSVDGPGRADDLDELRDRIHRLHG